MKKLLLSCSLVLAGFAANAQIYSATDTADFINWTYVDLDGDGFGWERVTPAATSPAVVANKQGILSRSWRNNVPLSPDNVIVSPAINCTAETSVFVSWTCTSPCQLGQDWYAEKYAVYIVKPSDLAATLAGNPPAAVFETTLTAEQVLFHESVDVSAVAAGETVHIVLRHYDCTDQEYIFFDNIKMTTASTANTEEISAEMEINAYPNPATETFNIAVNAVEAVSATIYSLDGKVVATKEFDGTVVTFDVANLEAGAYTYEVISANGEVHRNKFIKE